MTDAIMQMALALFFNISSQVTSTDFFNSVFPPKHRTLDYLLCVQLRYQEKADKTVTDKPGFYIIVRRCKLTETLSFRGGIVQYTIVHWHPRLCLLRFLQDFDLLAKK